MRRGTAAVGALVCAWLGCAGPPTPSPSTARPRPVATRPPAPAAAPPAADAAEPSGPEISVPDVAAGLRPRLVDPDAAPGEGAERDLAELPGAIGALFAGIRAGALPTRLVSDDEARRSADALAAVAPRAPCPVRVLSVAYRAPRRIEVDVEVTDDGGTLGEARVEALRADDGALRFSVASLLPSLGELVALRAAREALRSVGPAVRSSGGGDFGEITVGAGADALRCVHLQDEEQSATRCWRGPWSAGRAAHFADDDVLCLAGADGGRRELVVRWPDGALHRGRCGPPARFARPASAFAPVEPPPALAALAAVEIAAPGEGVLVLETLGLEQLCLTAGGRLRCALAEPGDDLFHTVRFDDPVVALDATGGGWMAVLRTRSEGGAEAQAGEHALVVLEIRNDQLRRHGVLPLGGYAAERGVHDPGVRSVWETTAVGHGQVDVDASGCVSVGPQSARHVVSDRVRRSRRESAASTGEPLPDRHHGSELPSLYDAMRLDAAGSWVPVEDGFARVASCVSDRPRRRGRSRSPRATRR